MGSIVTFYSFKGGVGRTMALANIAILLAQMGKKVLMVDWDLEAPGLSHYFANYDIEGNNELGLLDLLSDAKNCDFPEEIAWQKYVSHLRISENCELHLITSGAPSKDYDGRVLDFKWDIFFEEFDGGDFIEHLRNSWRENFDFVLVDSRTGITDSGGICTIQIPDILAIVFTANYQSLYGVKKVALKAQEARQTLAFDRMPLLVLPIPSRFDGRTEFEESQRWLRIFEDELKPFYSDWLPKRITPLQVIEKNKLPYVAYFSFGEKLPVVIEGTSDPESLGRAYLTNATLLYENFQGISNLVENDSLQPVRNLLNEIRWLVPYPRNPFFTGREALLESIHTVLTSRGRVALSGLGGIGKTQTALEYAYRRQHEYDYIFWVRAEQKEELISGYVAVAQDLQIPGCQREDQLSAVSLMKRWLTTHEGWLLVLDNADDLYQLRPFLPTASGHILITTRAQALGDLAQSLAVNQMDVDEGALFLLRRAGVIAAQSDCSDVLEKDLLLARRLTAEMDGLPLALEQAGAYIEEQSLSLEEYLELFQSEKAELLKERGRLDPDHPSVTVNFTLAFEKVASANLLSAELVRGCAFLSPDAIPEEIFTEGAKGLGEPLSTLVDSKLALTKAIAEAARFSLISRDSQAKTLSIHRLVQVVLRSEMDRESQTRWAEGLIGAVTAVFPDAEYENWPRCDRLLSQSKNAIQLIADYGLESETAALLLNRTGYYFEQLGRYSEAEPLYVEALGMNKRLLGAEHPAVASSLNNLAGLYASQGRYSEAEPLYVEALGMNKRLLGAEHPAVASSLNNLAGLYASQGRYSEAEPLYVEALGMNKRLLGAEHPDVASSLNNLAGLYASQGRYSEAEPLYVEALGMNKRLLGAEHPDVALSLNNLASLYDSQGRYSEAEPLYVEALGLSKRLLGAEHPAVASSLNNLASLYDSQGRYSEAEPLYVEALGLSKRLLGAEHPDVARSLNNLAGLYTSQGRYSEAEPLYVEALGMRKRLLGAEHPDVARSLNNLAGLYTSQGRYSEAEPLYVEALGLSKRLLGAEHPAVARSLNNLAGLYASQGRYSEAEPLYVEALGMRKRLLGAEHPAVASSLLNLGAMRYQQQQFAEAEALLLEALPIYQQALGENHPNTQNLLSWLNAVQTALSAEG